MSRIIHVCYIVIALSYATAYAASCEAVGKRSVRPLAVSAETQKKMAKYSLVAYENADPTNRVKALLFTPKPMGTSALPMVVYIPGNGELGEVGRHFRQPVILERVTSRAFQGKYPCFLLALTPPHGATTLLGCAIPLACGFYDAPYAQWMMDNTIPRLIWYLLPVPLFAWSYPRRGHAILQNVGIDFKG